MLKPRAVEPAQSLLRDAHLGVLLMAISNRMSAGASGFYRKGWNLGMPEWRAMLAIGHTRHLIVSDVARGADLDNALCSKTLKALSERRLVAMTQTGRVGRAAVVSLTRRGLVLFDEIDVIARSRQARLLSAFADHEIETLWTLLRKLDLHVADMNAEDSNLDQRRPVAKSSGRSLRSAAAQVRDQGP